jgi:hypothetical protein
MCNDNAVKRLKDIGFEEAAVWEIQGRGIRYCVHGDKQQQERMKALFAVNNALYAFCCGKEVLYIGKTSRSLGTRLTGYCRPGLAQRTNLKCNALIKAKIAKNEKIEIFAFAPQKDLPMHCGFQVNLAAGLEDILILDFNPPWNGGAIGAKLTETAEREANLMMQEPVPDGLLEPIPEIGRFAIKLGSTAFKKGVINVETRASGLLGKHDEGLTVMFCDGMPSISTHIDRTAKANKSVRLNGGQAIAAWFQANFNEGDEVIARILGSHLIELNRMPIAGGGVQLRPAM